MKTDTATVSGDIFCSDGESTKPNDKLHRSCNGSLMSNPMNHHLSSSYLPAATRNWSEDNTTASQTDLTARNYVNCSTDGSLNTDCKSGQSWRSGYVSEGDVSKLPQTYHSTPKSTRNSLHQEKPKREIGEKSLENQLRHLINDVGTEADPSKMQTEVLLSAHRPIIPMDRFKQYNREQIGSSPNAINVTQRRNADRQWKNLLSTSASQISPMRENNNRIQKISMEQYHLSPNLDLSNDSRLEAVEKRLGHLEEKSNQLEYDLKRERQEKRTLEAEVERLKQDNERLQEEADKAASQLRKFTEWFFNTIDKR